MPTNTRGAAAAFDALKHSITVIAGMTEAEMTTLTEATGTSTTEDLSYLSSDDIKLAIPEGAIVKLQILKSVILYLQEGLPIERTTTATIICEKLRAAAKPPLSPMPAARSPTCPIIQQESTSIKTPLNCIKEFSGDPIEFEAWDISSRETLGQTPHVFLLTRAPVSSGPNSAREKQQNIELYNMLVNAVSQGDAYHIIQADTSQNGHKGWSDIQAYYNSDTSIAMVVQHYQAKMRGLELNADMSASAYINEFKICCQNLEKYREGFTLEQKKRKFLDGVQCPDYDIVKTVIETHVSKYTFDDMVEIIKKQEINMLKSASRDAAQAYSCRLKQEHDHSRSSKSQGNGDGDKEYNVPNFPHFIYWGMG
jgi:hypothetical protein